MRIIKLEFSLFILISILFLTSSCGQQIENSNSNTKVESPVITTMSNTEQSTKSNPSQTSITIPTTHSLSTDTINSKNTVTPISNINLKSSEYRWLLGIPCKIPCWENITLGSTTYDQTLNALKLNPSVTINYNDINKSYIKFKWSAKTISDGNQSLDYSSIFFDNQHTANMIILKLLVDFADIIKYYGQPDFVIAVKIPYADYNPTKPYAYSYYLLYEDQGMILEGSQDNKFNLSSNFNLKTVIFAEPNLANALQYLNIGNGTPVTWEGFKDFDYYCRDTTQANQRCT